LIGKRLTAVSTDEAFYAGDESLLEQVSEIKKVLKKTWETIYKREREIE
jgi:hypothetical protein